MSLEDLKALLIAVTVALVISLPLWWLLYTWLRY